MRPNKLIAALLIVSAVEGRADLLDRVNDTLSVYNPKTQFQLQLTGLLDLESYFLDQPPPGLIFTRDDFLFNPRLTLFLDIQWTPHFYAFVQTRVDRGFDPSDSGAQIRLDEYFVRYTPFDDRRINVQIGKFATVFGTWVQRHYSWDNPFINGPFAYENTTGIWDAEAPEDVEDLLYWGHVPSREYGAYSGAGYADKYQRLPIIWGPSYATGASLSGTIGRFDYAAEIKNAALASRPEYWDLTEQNFAHPSFNGHLAFRPNAMWNFGLSAAAGPYLSDEAAVTLPLGRGIGDYRELVLGEDISVAWHHFQFWAEFFEARFQVPRIGNADTFSYYLEAKYKITPQLFAALRWNQQLFSTVREAGSWAQWGPDTWRIDGAVGYRFTNYLQGKVQYSFTDGEYQKANNLLALQLTLKF